MKFRHSIQFRVILSVLLIVIFVLLAANIYENSSRADTAGRLLKGLEVTREGRFAFITSFSNCYICDLSGGKIVKSYPTMTYFDSIVKAAENGQYFLLISRQYGIFNTDDGELLRSLSHESMNLYEGSCYENFTPENLYISVMNTGEISSEWYVKTVDITSGKEEAYTLRSGTLLQYLNDYRNRRIGEIVPIMLKKSVGEDSLVFISKKFEEGQVTVDLYDYKNNRIKKSFHVKLLSEYLMREVLSGGSRVFIRDKDGTFLSIDLAGEKVFTIEPEYSEPLSPGRSSDKWDVSPDGGWLGILDYAGRKPCSKSQKIKIYSVETGKLQSELVPGEVQEVIGFRIIPQYDKVVVAYDKYVSGFDVRPGKLVLYNLSTKEKEREIILE